MSSAQLKVEKHDLDRIFWTRISKNTGTNDVICTFSPRGAFCQPDAVHWMSPIVLRGCGKAAQRCVPHEAFQAKFLPLDASD